MLNMGAASDTYEHHQIKQSEHVQSLHKVGLGDNSLYAWHCLQPSVKHNLEYNIQ